MCVHGIVAVPLATRLQGSLHLTVSLSLGDVAALVPLLLASRERELDFGTAVLEVELRGHERQAALRNLSGKRRELLLVQQELAVAIGIVVRDVPLLVDRDVGADQPCFLAADVRVGLLKRGTAVPEGLHLGPCQNKACLHALEEVVVVSGPPVVDDELLAGFRHVGDCA